MLVACENTVKNTIIRLQGKTMGTSWHVSIVNYRAVSTASLEKLITQKLARINQQFSTYIPESEISRFNAQESTQPFAVSPEVVTVVKAAQTISEKSLGAFDISVAPLVDLWGFGKDVSFTPPTDNAISQVMPYIGYSHLKAIDNPPRITKNIPQVKIDLSSIAKGYAVDQIAQLLEAQRVDNYLIEIGGEIKVKGVNLHNEAWHIAIEKPVDNATLSPQVIQLENMAVATSGDYHNYFEDNGVRYSHTINPNTGRPITHHLASVTVLHPSAMLADGLATAIMVLGEKKGLAFAEREGLQVYMLARDSTSKNGFTVTSTLRTGDATP